MRHNRDIWKQRVDIKWLLFKEISRYDLVATLQKYTTISMCVNNTEIYVYTSSSSSSFLCFFFLSFCVSLPLYFSDFREFHAQCVHKPDVDMGLTKPNTFATVGIQKLFGRFVAVAVAVRFASYSNTVVRTALRKQISSLHSFALRYMEMCLCVLYIVWCSVLSSQHAFEPTNTQNTHLHSIIRSMYIERSDGRKRID